MTLSTLMYYTGIDPYSGMKVYVARSVEDKRKQKEFFFWYKKKPRLRPDTSKSRMKTVSTGKLNQKKR